MTSDEYEGLDLGSPEFAAAWDDITQDISAQCPIAPTAQGWLLTRYEDVRAALQDWEAFSSGIGGINPWRTDGFPMQKPLELDPPLHGKFRRPFQKLFAPEPTHALEPAIRATARELLAPLTSKTEIEVAAEFVRPFVGTVFFREILGLPTADAEAFTELMHATFNGPPEGRQAAATEYTRRVDWVLRNQQNGAGSSEFIATLLDLEVDGCPASWSDQCDVLSVFIIGGLDTTVFSIVAALKYLSENAEHRRILVEDPALMPAAVEETLRLWAPVFILKRTAARDVEVRGTRISEGDSVLVSYALANRDPLVFDDPLTFRPDREVRNHLTFGAGPHRCIGSHLARVEMQVALEEFLAAMPEFEPLPDVPVEYTTGTTIRGVNKLGLRVLGATAASAPPAEHV